MVEGYVNELLEPIVEIGLVQEDRVTTIPAVVDTGFSGYLCLSEQHIAHLDMTFEFAEAYELANGEVIIRDVFQGSVVFDGWEQEIHLILTASYDTLIGASLLQGYSLNIDYPGQMVRIEQTA
jgi:clan AA aspartic protease